MADNLSLKIVVGDLVPMVWNDYGVGEIVAKEAWRAGGRFSAESAYEALLSGSNQLWLILEDSQNIKAVLITDVTPYPGGQKICTISFAAGQDAGAWAHLVQDLERWAKENGCTKIELWGRDGWARHLRHWRKSMVLLELSLENETEEND